MKEHEAGETLKKICPTCGKRIAAGRRPGSLTAYLFGASDCTCTPGGDPPKSSQTSSERQTDNDSDFCPKCGLQIVTKSRDGSLTGFLFQSTRCKCPQDQTFADGNMSAKFWKLKQTDGGTIFASATATTSPGTISSIGLAPGATIGGVYKIIELVGRGGMGEVYLARHETLGKKCALKVIPPEQVNEMGWQRFQQEARAVAKLDHVNLVRVTDLGIHDGCLPFYAMDYVDGKNLAELLAERGPMPLNTMLEIFMQVCDGVECAHRHGILHRDLKPANIMVTSTKSGTSQAKVLDFGLAKLTRNDRTKQSLTAAGDVFGSPFYMSPEQCSGDKLDMRSDIYSLGCTMFECLTGRPPFAGNLVEAVLFGHLEGDPPTLESIVGPGKYPESMEIVIAKLLRKNLVERYQNLVELKGDLEKVARREEVQPFYESRSTHLDGGAKTTRSATGKKDSKSDSGESTYSDVLLFENAHTDEEELSAPGRTRALLLACICSLAVLVTIFALWTAVSFFSARNQTQTVTNDSKLESTPSEFSIGREETPEIAHAREVFQKCPHISHGVGDKDGIHGRIFEFPEVPLGIIRWGLNGQNQNMARGTVIVPADERVTLQLSQPEGKYARMFPEVLSKIGPEDIFAFEIRDPPGLQEEDPVSSEVSAKLVMALKEWKAMRRILLSCCKVPREALLALNNLSSKIEVLSLRSSHVNGNNLAAVKWLKDLTYLDAKDMNNIDPVLQALAGATSLRKLTADNTIPSKAALQALTTCPNLQILYLSEADIDDEKLAVICDIPSLYSLNLRRAIVTPKALHQLTKLKKLGCVNLTAVSITEAEINKLSHDLPRSAILTDFGQKGQTITKDPYPMR